MNGNVFVDTNVFVYLRDTADSQKQNRANQWISHLWKTGNGRLSMQVITEYYSVVTVKLKPGIDIPSAREDVDDMLAWQPLPLTQDVVVESWNVQDLFHISWWDSLIVTAARRQGCSILLSEDFQHNQVFEDLRVINPFILSPGEVTQP
jgi:predicted nucleic acid-binding protein